MLATLVGMLNTLGNFVGGIALAPLALLPGWLSATCVAVATGVVMLVAYKYTSNQPAIKRARDEIKANLLALSLFRDQVGVSLRAQRRILRGAGRLLWHSLTPMIVMFAPMLLVLNQLGLWYQARPLQVGEQAVLTLQLAGDADSPWPNVSLAPTEAVNAVIGPLKVRSQRAVCWTIEAKQTGYHSLQVRVDDETIDKQIAVGQRFMRVSLRRPEATWSDQLLHPAESPLGAKSLARSVEIDYPTRDSWTCGADAWVIYWFAVSMAAALAFRRVFNVHL